MCGEPILSFLGRGERHRDVLLIDVHHGPRAIFIGCYVVAAAAVVAVHRGSPGGGCYVEILGGGRATMLLAYGFENGSRVEPIT